MDLGLAGKVVFITGAGHGIGRAFALRFAEEGASIAIADINAQWGEGTATAIAEREGKALAIHCDVGDAEQVRSAVRRTARDCSF